MKKADESRNYFIEEINQNELISKKHKNVRRVMNYIEHLLILISTFTGCVPISAFSSLFGIPIGITSSAVILIAVIAAGCKKYNSIIKKKEKKKKHDLIALLARSKLNNIEVLISKDLIDSYVTHD